MLKRNKKNGKIKKKNEDNNEFGIIYNSFYLHFINNLLNKTKRKKIYKGFLTIDKYNDSK